MGRKAIDITGKKFGRLTAIGIHSTTIDKRTKWTFLCECGAQVIARLDNVKNGNTTSCGCLQKELISAVGEKNRTTHGLSTTPEYTAWRDAKQRCYSPKNKRYKDYGARGITMCERWLNSFENFYSDMGKKPSKNHSLDRKNNDGPYSPSNCRWATLIEQANNKQKSKQISSYKA